MTLVTSALLFPAPCTLFRCGLFLEPGELDDRELGRIATAEAELHDSRIATGAFLVARRDLIEELLNSLMRLQVREGAALGGEVTLLAQRHHPIGKAAQLLGLLIGGGDATALHQRKEHI